ncbi:MAG: hypothetical protein JSS36_04575 [Proteobacteria bacterium]|nr:hypothetical protein [Pseudomonadota bacterium]
MPRPLMIALPLLAALSPAPALAAGGSGSEKMNMVIVYGDDPCPRSEGNEITVCARKDEGERYRIPPNLRESSAPSNVAWTNRVKSYEMVGASGIASCSPVGAGGWTGCASKFINDAYADKKAQTDVHFSDMIAAERAKREATVEGEAAEQQAQVEAVEKAQAARKAAEAAAREAGETAQAVAKETATTPPKP